MSLLAVGISHQTAPVALLEQFAMAADDRSRRCTSWSTATTSARRSCWPRATGSRSSPRSSASTAASPTSAGCWPARPAPTVEELSPYVTVHYEDQAVAHLFTVAAGLDSMVVGETQVLGQLRAAYGLARDEGTVGRALHPVAQRALRVGKRVHTETGIDRAGASLVVGRPRPGRGRARRAWPAARSSWSAPARWARSRPRRWPAAAPTSSSAPAPRPRRAAGRQHRRPRRRRSPTSPTELAAADVLVTCTGATGLVVGTDVVAGRHDRPHGRPLVDRRPRPAPGRRPGRRRACPACTWSTWLCCRASGPRDGRPAGRRPVAADDIAAAHALVETETALLRAERQAAEVAPTVSALRSQAAEVVDAELLRLVRPGCPTWTPAPARRSPAPCAGSSTSCCTSPTVRVKELAAAPGGTDYAGALRALFGLGIDAARAARSPTPSRSTPSRGRGVVTAAHPSTTRRCGWAPAPARSRAPSPRPSPTRSPRPPARRSSWCTSSPRATAPSAAIAAARRHRRVRRAIRAPCSRASIDLAVHSYKDLPTAPEPGLIIAAVPRREDPRDALVARDGLDPRRAAARLQGGHRRPAPGRPAARARPRAWTSSRSAATWTPA